MIMFLIISFSLLFGSSFIIKYIYMFRNSSVRNPFFILMIWNEL
jgi:hypothetical protein